MAKTVQTFLMFEGRAEEAMTFYASLFEGSRVTSLQKREAGMPGQPGTILGATLSLGGQNIMFFDSDVHHQFTFTPSTSLFVTCESADELERLYQALSDGGAIMMPLDNYGFSQRFGWVADRYGVSWQLNLP